ncbi:MAG: riboflavin synthase [Bacteroidetes bacterium]|nr:riboflavin synthase [Bacteroidota bacterium]MCY4232134.1 riboflavin synthase [Bacteroidota bacterium]
MFTGLIEQVGHLESISDARFGRELVISSRLSSELSIGQSIAINGICLSITDSYADRFSVMAVPETLSKTTLGDWKSKTPINLERSMLPTARLDGHIVQGHVDTISTITKISQQKDERIYEIPIPEKFSGLVVPRGSISIDGISLTIANLFDLKISIAIIPHTFHNTNVSSWQLGTSCNIEFDILGKYAARQMSIHLNSE